MGGEQQTHRLAITFLAGAAGVGRADWAVSWLRQDAVRLLVRCISTDPDYERPRNAGPDAHPVILTKQMETILERTNVTVVEPSKPTHVKRGQIWEKWGIWAVIAVGIIVLFSLTDFGDFMKGMREGAADKSGSGALSIGMIVAVFFVALIVFAVFIGVLSLLAQLYYKFFHNPVFKNNQVSYTILYVLCLLLAWNFMSQGFAMFLERYKGSELTVKRSDHNDVLSSVFASLLLIYVVVYGFISDFRKSQRRQLALTQQRIQAELDALKAQVNPHFLFNSLNSIYGTALVEDSPRTAESIQQLSGIVRYVMEESRLQTTDVRRELRFIDDYVELQRVRIPNQENIEITTDIEWDEKPAQIVPLLLNPLIENAFKYGVSIQYPCFVRIHLLVQDGTLKMTTENSVLPRTDLEKGAGIGLANVRQRLALAYPNQHKLTVEETDAVFLVDLTINL